MPPDEVFSLNFHLKVLTTHSILIKDVNVELERNRSDSSFPNLIKQHQFKLQHQIPVLKLVQQYNQFLPNSPVFNWKGRGEMLIKQILINSYLHRINFFGRFFH